jgi:hypothetical protein
MALEDGLIMGPRGSASRGLVDHARRAPSSHNTQRWWFRVTEAAIDLIADRTRALPVNDPEDRELTISCGAALMNLHAVADWLVAGQALDCGGTDEMCKRRRRGVGADADGLGTHRRALNVDGRARFVSRMR